MSQGGDATSFFREISAKISAAKQTYSSRPREEEPQQPVASPQSVAANNGRHCQQVNGALTTQVRQHRDPNDTATLRPSTGKDPTANRNPNNANNSNNVNKGNSNNNNNNNSNSNSNRNNSSSPSGPGGGGFGVKPKVHASDLVERSRRIRGQPKNTSPIDARRHPSLLPPQMPQHRTKKTLILDLDETLVHSSLSCQPKQYDLMIEVQVNNANTTVYVAFRPFLHEFIRAIAPLFEVVIFTASVSIYCNPLMDAVDPEGILGPLRLYREHCSMVNGAYVKDLSLLGRDLNQVAIVDNSPVTYLFQQRNAIPITSWFEDVNDEELRRLIPVLEALAEANVVYDVLDNYNAILQLQQEQLQSSGDTYSR